MKKNTNKKIGLLCTIDGPILSFYIESLLDAGFKDLYLIADLKGFGKENLIRFKERTNNLFHSRNLSLGDFAEYRLPVFFVNSHNDNDCIDLISSLKLDLLVNVGTPRKLSSLFLKDIGIDVLNVHPGVLPAYRGSSCVEWAILNNDPIGNSAHFMAEEYDAGPIIKIEKYNFTPGSTYKDIRNKVYENAIRLMSFSVGLIFQEGLTSQNMKPQSSDFQPYSPITSEEMKIVYEKIKNNSHPAISLPDD